MASWTLGPGGFRNSIGRRAVLGPALAAGTAAMLLGSKRAAALTRQSVPPVVLGAIPERDGVVPWRTLALADVQYGQQPTFPAELQQLEGRQVVIEGHMMVMEDGAQHRRFLLTAYNAHCPFCMPGGARRLSRFVPGRPSR